MKDLLSALAQLAFGVALAFFAFALIGALFLLTSG